MASRDGLKPTGSPGVFYKEHEARKHGVKHDRQWVIRQTLGGQTRISVLGWMSEGILLGDALNKADEFKTNFKQNRLHPNQPLKPICIADELRIAEVTKEDNPTFEAFSERFLTHYVDVKLKESTAKEYKRQINKILIPAWGDRRIIDIERKQITRLAENISKKTPVQANRTLATIKKIFSYALDVGAVAFNPATGIKPPGKESIKDRVLNMGELVTLFIILDEQYNRDTTDILKLIALTAQRPGEVAEMRISQFKEEVDGTWWGMAGSEVKNKTAHRVYLNDQALQIIQNRIHDFGLNNYIFPTTKKDGSISFMRKDVVVKRVRKLWPSTEAKGIEKFTAHDLRRSAATGIAQLGYGAIVADILNHTPPGITRKVYDKYSWGPEIKIALTAWGEAVQRAVSGTQANIIEINS